MTSFPAIVASLALAAAAPQPSSASPDAFWPGEESTSAGEPATLEQDPLQALDRRAQLLEEAYHAVALDREHHERLIDGYQRAIKRSVELGAEAYVDRFLLGLARAAALALDQVGTESYRELVALALDDLIFRVSCRDPRQDDDALQLEEARLMRKRHVGGARAWPSCPATVKATPPPPRPTAGGSTIDAPEDRRRERQRDLALLGVGGGVFAAGVAAVVVGAMGRTIAERSGRLLDPPTPEQQRYLDEQLPRRRAAWISVGSIAMASGIAMLVAGGILLARARRDRGSARLGGRKLVRVGRSGA